jgi:hypothetical protein
VKIPGPLIVFFLLLIILASTAGIFFNFERIKRLAYPEIENISIPDNKNKEIEKDSKPVISYPDTIKAVYATSWSMSKESYVDYIIELASSTEINAVVIDIKDFSGYVAYDTKLAEVEKYKAKRIRIKDLGALVKKLHDQNIYAIARISVFQDPVLANARPDLAVLSKSSLLSQSTSSYALWSDNWGLNWADPSAKEVWEYNALIAKDVLSYGFDELNFDYVRFPSDGDLGDMVFPSWDQNIEKHLIIREFFKHLRQELPDTIISIDLFGLATVGADDLGIGQIIEDGYEYFDYICPMVYPSHYASGFSGYETPSEHPYEVVERSMKGALRKLNDFKRANNRNVKLRPWLQDFTLTIPYDAEKVKLEIAALKDVLGQDFNGFMLWNSQNFYTKEALSQAE